MAGERRRHPIAIIDAALALQRNLHDVALLDRLWSVGGSRYENRIRPLASGNLRKRT